MYKILLLLILKVNIIKYLQRSVSMLDLQLYYFDYNTNFITPITTK